MGAQEQWEPVLGVISALSAQPAGPQGALLLAEELAAAPAVVPSLCEGEPHRAARAAVPAFVLHPVVGSTAAWLVTHRPAEHAASAVPNQDPAVIPAGDTTQGHLRDSLRTATWTEGSFGSS